MTPHEIDAQRERMLAERQARIDAQRAAEKDVTLGPLLKAVDFLSAAIPAAAVPAFIRVMRNVPNSADLAVVLANVETRNLRAQAEAQRLREAVCTAENLKSLARRHAELDQGAL